MENSTKEINRLEQEQAQPAEMPARAAYHHLEATFPQGRWAQPAEMPARAAYWQEEQPLVLIAGNLSLTFFERTGVLQIGFLVTDAQGQRRLGRKISLRKEVISKTPRALFFLRDVFKNWSREYDENSKSKES